MEGTRSRLLLLCLVFGLAGQLARADTDTHGNHEHAGHGSTSDDNKEKTEDNADEKHTQKTHTWSYNIEPVKLGPSMWNRLFPKQCGPMKSKQSPIDIVVEQTELLTLLNDLDIITAVQPAMPPATDEAEAEAEAEAEGEADTEAEKKVEVKVVQEPNGENGKAEAADKSGAPSNEGENEGDGKDTMQKDNPAPKTPESEKGHMYLFNNGHTAQVDVTGDVFLTGAELGSQYKVAQFHFHWGKNGSAGSEHRINGEMFPLEMHIVTYDSERYGSLGEAVGQYNSIAVMGILFKPGKHNSNLNSVVNNLDKVVQPDGRDGKVEISWIDLRSVLPDVTHRYFRYEGSLTTPSCDETVKWTLFAEHPEICPHQLSKFYRLLEGHAPDGSPVNLVNNWRPPQPLKDRSVYRSFTPDETLVEYNVVNNRDNDGSGASSLALSLSLLLAALLRGFL